MLRSSIARMVPSSIGISYRLPVRLSPTVSESCEVAVPEPSCRSVSVVNGPPFGAIAGAPHGTPPTRANDTVVPRMVGEDRLLAGGDRHCDRHHDQSEAD